MVRIAGFVAVSLLAASPASAQVNPGDLKWGPAPAIFPRGAAMVVLSGNPAGPGQFVIRLRLPAGYDIPAHNHPSDEYVTVISGDFSLGMGDRLDKAGGAHLGPGGFAEAPRHMNHFAWTDGGAVVQVWAEGPFSMTYVNPADTPK